MAEPTNPSEIARETLRQLAMRRTPPTPENYLRLYHEIAGTKPAAAPVPERFVRRIAQQLPRDTAERQRLARQLDQALNETDTGAAERALDQYLACLSAEKPQAWNELIATLLRQWEGRQLGWTSARKRESLERVLGASDPNTLHTRLQALLRAWGQAPVDPERPAPGETPELPEQTPQASTASTPSSSDTLVTADADATELIRALRELLALTMESVLPAFLTDHPELISDARLIANATRSATDTHALAVVGKQLRKFAHRLEMTAADDSEIRAGLLDLLKLLLENIDELVIDDQWLGGQIEMLRDIVDKPATPRLIDDASRRLKEVIYKQSQLKHNLSQAQLMLKEMLAGFVDQLASFAESTGSYHDRMGSCARKIAAARDISEIGHLLDEVMTETRSIQIQAERSRDDLSAARQRALDAEKRIDSLHKELEEASHLVRHDQLTGSLNRRGLEEVFIREAARAQRHDIPLCVALLDIDNFKKLNDTLGHQTGDDALVHLSRVVRDNLRPQDTLARYGGEEFVIILPETTLEQADQTLVRLQRELTRVFFMSGEQRVVITFSAGVTPRAHDETIDVVLARADAAMYEAKQSGKNRVVRSGLPQEAGNATLS
ncbi:GGDEF domain-containing protein [Parazoarcus communis]|uniref:diguanylate cyclase n=1 Tax=Parazoarcus communis TaxID=41977 RepID=A0A2U8H3G6_9RHOO|nr:GGDEF domain-containing protein [Parazoarcus communis]AWI80351.1 GGDEF domain-containing protein [Parazoarcus communis]